MTLKVLTYNIYFNRAKNIIENIIDRHQPDIICLQEVETTEMNLKNLHFKNYGLADFSNSFIQFNRFFGLVTFYNKKRLKFIGSENFSLPRSVIETILLILRGPRNYRTVLKTEFYDRNNPRTKIVNYNIHLTAFGSNGTRLKQIQETFADMKIEEKCPTIITGDFNFPYGRRKFESLIKKYQLKEATNKLFFTQIGKLFGIIPIKLKLDYILFRNIRQIKTKRIAITNSDHFPIFSTFSIETPAN